MFVIKVNDGPYAGQYVSRPGSRHSYTRKMEEARTFPTEEAAKEDACGNETVHPVESLLHTPRRSP